LTVKRGIIARDLVTGEIERHSAHAVVIASGGYGNVFSYLLTRWVVITAAGKYIKELLLILATQIPYLYPRQEITNLN
jgi:hypothetical protein